MNRIWKFGWTCFLTLGLAWQVANAQTQVVLEHVPANTDRVFVFASLQGLSDDLLALGNLTGMQQLVPPNPLMMIQAESGLMLGVDANAPTVIMLNGKMPMRPGEDDSVMSMLLPMTAKDQFMQNFADIKVDEHDGGIQSANLKGEVIYFKPVTDKYMLMSDKLEQVSSYKKPAADHWLKQQGKICIDQMTKSDLVILYSPDALKKDVPKKSPLPLQVQTADLMKDVQGAAASFTVNADGIDLGFAMQFKPNTSWQSFFAKAPAQKISGFEMMPDRAWILASKVMLSHLNLQQFSDNIIASLPEDQKPVVDTKPLFEAMSGYEKLEQMLVADAQGQWKVVNALKHPGYTKEMFAQFQQSLTDAQKQLADNPDVPVTFENQADALDIPGALGTHVLTIKSNDEMINQGMMRNAGTDALKVYFAYTDKGVVSVMGDEDLLKRSVDAMAADELETALGKTTQVLQVNLPENCFAAGYMNLTQTIRFVQTMMLKNPATAQYAMILSMIQLPEDMPPLVGNIANTDGGVRFGVFLPSKTVSITAQRVKQLWMMMAPMMNPQQQEPDVQIQ